MVESRWLRWIGPGIVALGAVALIGSATVGRRDADLGASCLCRPAGRPDRGGARRDTGDRRATSRRLHGSASTRSQRTTARSARQRLVVGRLGETLTQTLDLPAESFAAGPFGRIVLTGSDDGSTSRLELVDVAGGCSWLVATERDVIRRATIDPAGATIYEMRVDRATRADLGIWRRGLDAAAPRRAHPRPDRARRPLRAHLLDRIHLGPRGRPARRPVLRRVRLPDPRRRSARRSRPRCSTRRTSGSSSAWTASGS